MRAQRHPSGTWHPRAMAGMTGSVLLAAVVLSTPAAAQSPAMDPIDDPIALVVIGDSIPHAGFCPQCTGWVERYADDLEARTGRPVEVRNRSRNDSATLPMIRQQVVDDTSLRAEVEDADVIIVSAGYNSLLPDPTVDVGCTDPGWGSTDADWVRWSLTATTPQCIQAGFDAYAADYDTLFGELVDLRVGKPTVMAAINVHNGNRAHPWLAATGLPQADIDAMEAYMTDIYDRWNVMLCDHAVAAGFECVDVYHLFNGPTGEESSAPWTIDNAHPSDVGSEGIAGLLGQLDISGIATTTSPASPGSVPAS